MSMIIILRIVHRRGQPDPGQLGANQANFGTAGEQDGDTPLYAGTELVQHGADEHPAGGPADDGNDRHPAVPDSGGRAGLSNVAENARVRVRLPGGLGRHQPPGSAGGGQGGLVSGTDQEAGTGK